MSVIKKLCAVGVELKAVQMTDMQRYKARHIYDIYNMLQPLLAKHGLMISKKIDEDIIERVEKNGKMVIHRLQKVTFTFYGTDDETSFSTQFCTESIDYGDKSSSQCDAMATKQMLIHTFLIPTKDMKDPDDEPQKEVLSISKDGEIVVNPKKLVSMPQLKRLMTIADKNGWSFGTVKEHLKEKYDIDSSKKLNMGQYNELVKHIQGGE